MLRGTSTRALERERWGVVDVGLIDGIKVDI